MLEGIPIQRFGTKWDIAMACIYLASRSLPFHLPFQPPFTCPFTFHCPFTCPSTFHLPFHRSLPFRPPFYPPFHLQCIFQLPFRLPAAIAEADGAVFHTLHVTATSNNGSAVAAG